jgi:hypothetical protein
MRHETLSIIGACALGAFIGTLLSLDIATHFHYGKYLWSIGALMGGIVAYVAVDFRHFCAGVAHSYRKTISWRPNGPYWRAWFAEWICMGSLVASMVMVFCMAIFVGEAFFDSVSISENLNGTMRLAYAGYVYFCPGFSMTLGLLLTIPVGRSPNETEADYAENLRQNRNRDFKRAINVNPFGVIFWLLYGMVWVMVHSPQLIVKVAKFVISVSSVLAQFIAGVFVYVHSSRRTLCFVDATLGAAIGYTFGSAIIGTIAGVVLGVINYELVSVRWLRLTPLTR